jgi:hypothetical protein
METANSAIMGLGFEEIYEVLNILYIIRGIHIARHHTLMKDCRISN